MTFTETSLAWSQPIQRGVRQWDYAADCLIPGLSSVNSNHLRRGAEALVGGATALRPLPDLFSEVQPPVGVVPRL